MKEIEVPTGEKTLFGREITETVKKPTGNLIISEKDFKIFKILIHTAKKEKLNS